MSWKNMYYFYDWKKETKLKGFLFTSKSKEIENNDRKCCFSVLSLGLKNNYLAQQEDDSESSWDMRKFLWTLKDKN